MEQPTVREAVAIFDDAKQLEGAVSELTKRMDRPIRAELSCPSVSPGHMAGDLGQAADHPATPRVPVVAHTDLRQVRVLGTSLARTIAAFSAAGFTVATGGIGAAIAAAAVASEPSARCSGANWPRSESFLDAQLARGGVLLWVRTRDVASEQTVLEVLRRRSEARVPHDLPTEAAALD
jgi:hypothetical protein